MHLHLRRKGLFVMVSISLVVPFAWSSSSTAGLPALPCGSSLHRPSIQHMLPALGQNNEVGEHEVSTDEVNKYVSVYKAMQRNRSLTVDQAAAAQGLTLEQFRQLENRVEHDDTALQQARDELQAAALQNSPNSREHLTQPLD